MSAQCLAGIGNLAAAVAMARLLPAREYAAVTAFLALSMLLAVPGAALSAAGAHDPARLSAIGRRIAAGAVVLGAAVVVTSPLLAPALGLDAPLVAALGCAAPAAALLGLGRGLAYGRQLHGVVAVSLVTEAAVRVGAGIAATLAAGTIGAAAATVGASYAAVAALLVSARAAGAPGRPRPDDRSPAVATAGVGLVAAATPFLLAAVLQSIDLIVANRVLRSDDAALFGVLSTIGGAAIFATATVPLVLLPALRRGGGAAAATTATGLTAAVGLGIAAVVTAGASIVVPAAFGDRYAGAARLVGPYLVAMAALAVAKVRIAVLVTVRPRWVIGSVATAVVAEGLLVALVARSPGAVVAVTLAVTTGLATVLELPGLASRRPVAAGGVLGGERARDIALLGALCVTAIVVRLATTRGLWVDEAISVRQAGLPFGELLDDVRTSDVHPPFHHAVLWVTVRLVGTSELAVRLPSLLAGVALVPVMAWVGRELFDRRTGLVAAALTTVAPFCVWYSQEARMYSQFMLFAAVAVGAQVLAVRRGRRRDWLLYAVATAAMAWSQYFAILPIVVQQAAFAVAWWRRRRSSPALGRRFLVSWIASTALIALLLVPLVPILRDQMAAYGHRGAGLVPGQAGAGNSTISGGVSVYAVGANLIWATLGYHADGLMVQVAALWPLLMLGVLVLLGRGRSTRSLLLAGLIVVPLSALFLVGSLKRDLFELRYFSGAVPALLLLLARFVTATAHRRAAVLGASLALVTVMSAALVDQQVNGANPRRYDFAGALHRVERRARPGDVVLYEPSYLADVIEYYAPELRTAPVGTAVGGDVGVWVLSTDRIVNAEASSARLGHELADLEEHRSIVDRFHTPNVLVWELR